MILGTGLRCRQIPRRARRARPRVIAMGQVYLVRHGQASAGADNYDELSPTGVAQSKLLGDWLGRCGHKFTRVATGSLKRHLQTAQACVASLPETSRPPGEWHTDPGFNEYDHDELMVRYRPDLADPKIARETFLNRDHGRRQFQEIFSAAMARWMSGRHDGEYRESWMAFRGRVVDA